LLSGAWRAFFPHGLGRKHFPLPTMCIFWLFKIMLDSRFTMLGMEVTDSISSPGKNRSILGSRLIRRKTWILSCLLGRLSCRIWWSPSSPECKLIWSFIPFWF
jgi:hypothetical protein